MTLKRSSETVREIADKLNVRYALEGSVRKAGNDLRITAQLIDAATDTHVWAEKYSGRLDDIFDIQQKVSRSIVGALRVQLTPKEEERMMKRPIADVAAYDYYLRARAALLSFTEEGVVSALNLLESGLKVIGDNALIYAGLGYAHVVSFMAGMPSAESLREATVCAEKAINLDPSVAQGHVVLGMVQASNNVTQSFRRLTYALTIDPGNYDARFWLMKAHWCVGRCPAGREIANLLIRLDPLNPMHFGMRSDLNFYDGRLDLAIQDMSPLRTAQPTNPLFRFYWAFLHIHAGRIEEALAALEPVESVSQPDFWTQMSRVLRQVILGDRKGAYALLTRGLVASLLIDAMNSCYLATIYALLDDDENTLDCLDNAVKLGFINYPYLSQHDRFLAKLRGEPRFQKLMERVKYEWENFEE